MEQRQPAFGEDHRASGQAGGSTSASKPFDDALGESGQSPLRATCVDVLQINLGRMCNQSCAHCHVQAGPDCVEIMSRETASACLAALERSDIQTVDLTGGAPELNPSFRFLVDGATALGRNVMVRTNLTVLLEPGCDDLPEYFAERRVQLIASMPCYTAENVDAQRGSGVYERSVAALKNLNAVGYGMRGSCLSLSLVYNPGGAFLPGEQSALEDDYRLQLMERHGVEFSNLLTIANMPIGRFRERLDREGELREYMQLLIDAYNPAAADAVMCRRTVSVGWDGRLYDCDFNQMLCLPCVEGSAVHISEFDLDRMASRRIVTGSHCYGCTAGAGSSCGGALV